MSTLSRFQKMWAGHRAGRRPNGFPILPGFDARNMIDSDFDSVESFMASAVAQIERNGCIGIADDFRHDNFFAALTEY